MNRDLNLDAVNAVLDTVHSVLRQVRRHNDEGTVTPGLRASLTVLAGEMLILHKALTGSARRMETPPESQPLPPAFTKQ